MSPTWGQLHLLLLDHPLAHHLVYRGLDETGADPFSVSIPFTIVDDEPGVIGDVGLQFQYILEHPHRRIIIRSRLLLAGFIAIPALPESIFQILETNGKVDAQEMYQVFNMGIGMVAIVAERHARSAIAILKAKRIGRIELGTGKVRLKF